MTTQDDVKQIIKTYLHDCKGLDFDTEAEEYYLGLIHNDKGEILICKKPKNLGVFAGQWALPGGGIEKGEKMKEALRREMKEEVGLEVEVIEPFIFKDDTQEKIYPDGSKEMIYMIYLLFDCRAKGYKVSLGEEFEEYAWVDKENLKQYDLNLATIDTFRKKGWID